MCKKRNETYKLTVSNLRMTLGNKFLTGYLHLNLFTKKKQIYYRYMENDPIDEKKRILCSFQIQISFSSPVCSESFSKGNHFLERLKVGFLRNRYYFVSIEDVALFSSTIFITYHSPLTAKHLITTTPFFYISLLTNLTSH